MEIPAYITYRAGLINPGVAGDASTATASSQVAGVTVVPGQGNLHFAPAPAFSQVTSSTFTIQVDQMVPISFGCLQWSFLGPVANAGPNQTAREGSTVTLNGRGSTNPRGVGTLSYSWTFSSRPPGTIPVLGDISGVTSSFVVDVPGSYGIVLTASNGADSDTGTVTVSTSNSPPVANGGPNQTVAVGAPTVSPTFVVDKAGTCIVQLSVNDGKLDSAPASTMIATQNTPPDANAGPNRIVNIGAFLQLNDSGSSDVDGDVLTYQWTLNTKPSGRTATMSSATAVNPTLTADRAGTCVAQLIVNDGKIASAPTTATITAANSALAAEAMVSPSHSVPFGSAVTLDGSSYFDSDHDLFTYVWSVTTRTVGSTAQLSSTTGVSPTLFFDVAGAYVVQLIVSDGIGSSNPTSVMIVAGGSTVALTLNPLNMATNTPGTLTITLGTPAGTGGQLTDLFSSNPSVADVPPTATVPRLPTAVNVTVTSGGGPGIAEIAATTPVFTPGVATVNVPAVLSVSLEVHQ